MKSKHVAAFLAFFMGIFGVHRFYLGRRFWGVMHFALFFITLGITIASDGEAPFIMVPAILGFIDAVLLFVMPTEEFDERYNRKWLYRDERDIRRPLERPRPVAAARPTSRGSEEMYYKKMGIKKFRERDYEGAIDDFLTALEINPDDAATRFNLACCFSLIRDAREGFYHLQKAVESGFRDVKKIRSHTALSFLRAQPHFEAFVANGYRLPVALSTPAPPLTLDLDAELELDLKKIPAEKIDQTEDLLDQIVKLGELRDQGILSDEEFAQQKRKILNG